jgi:hypothetical protein
MRAGVQVGARLLIGDVGTGKLMRGIEKFDWICAHRMAIVGLSQREWSREIREIGGWVMRNFVFTIRYFTYDTPIEHTVVANSTSDAWAKIGVFVGTLDLAVKQINVRVMS